MVKLAHWKRSGAALGTGPRVLEIEPIEEATASAKAPAALPMFAAIRALSWVTQATLRTEPLKQLHWRSQRNSAKPTAMKPAIRAARATKKAHLT
jgi:hypothetical protein